jgi:transcriptional regulator with XRE-family HTH domain
MLAQTLQRLIDHKLTSASEIAELTGVAASTVYRWIKGESEPSFNTVRLLVRHLPNAEAQRDVLATFTAGTDWQFYAISEELDINKDGVIDHEDALDACIESVHAAGEALSQVRLSASDAPNKRSRDDELVHLLSDVIRHSSAAQRILVHMIEHRRPARHPSRR